MPLGPASASEIRRAGAEGDREMGRDWPSVCPSIHGLPSPCGWAARSCSPPPSPCLGLVPCTAGCDQLGGSLASPLANQEAGHCALNPRHSRLLTSPEPARARAGPSPYSASPCCPLAGKIPVPFPEVGPLVLGIPLSQHLTVLSQAFCPPPGLGSPESAGCEAGFVCRPRSAHLEGEVDVASLMTS